MPSNDLGIDLLFVIRKQNTPGINFIPGALLPLVLLQRSATASNLTTYRALLRRQCGKPVKLDLA